MDSGPDSVPVDAAKRMAETIALHQQLLTRDELFAGRFIAIRLADGGSDGVAYDNNRAMVLAQRNAPSRHAYMKIPMERLSWKTCRVLLWYQRGVYDSGFRADPAHALMVPNAMEELGL